MSAHDRWLEGYVAYTRGAYCRNGACPDYAQTVIVEYAEENGQGTITPEECPTCGDNLTLDDPHEAL